MFELTPAVFLILLVTYLHISLVIFSIYCHRSLSHRAVIYHIVVEKLFRFVLWVTMGVQNNYKTASHIQHHIHTDQPGDPHSVHIDGFYKLSVIRMLNGLKTTLLFFDIQRGQSVEYLKKYSVDYADDYTTNFPRIGKLCFLIFNTVLFGITGIILYITFHLVVSLITVVIVDIGGHTVGYRNFKLNNKSTNLPLFGLLGGEELHHNHHKYPGHPKYSTKWYEVDSGWAWIYLLSKCKLAKFK